MQRSIQILGLLLAAISLIGGLADVATQYFDGQEIHWRVPITLIGFGIGIPTIILPFWDWEPAKTDEHDYDENDLSSVYQNGPKYMSSSSSGDSGTDYHDYDADATD